MLERIWAYVCRLVSIARPRRLVYLAIDGVAPRAKMNQQRSRRFRAAREAEQKAEVHAKLKQEWLARGLKLPPKLKGSQEEWDSNVITVRLTDMAAHADEEAAMQTRRDVHVCSGCSLRGVFTSPFRFVLISSSLALLSWNK